MAKVDNANLTESNMPPPQSDWDTLNHFALTFNGYEYWGSFEKCAEIGNKYADLYKKTNSLPQSLTELRTCLFFEQRRWRHFGYEPDKKTMTYLYAVMEAMRSKVHAGEIE